jgi:hypothetical protein
MQTTSVKVYKSGTIMVQGILMQFQLGFYRIKERAQQEKVSVMTPPS